VPPESPGKATRERRDWQGMPHREKKGAIMGMIEKIRESRQYVAEAKQELNKVTWPTRQQAISSTWVVIAVVFLIAIFLGMVDFGLSRLVKYILS
jgi:preprotein translocase subunit SecE